ncbi:MAG: aspartate kinase [Lachnospiraceae bacterium]|nr:aspartate kinase [Lachnospiraceae bacterium]
MIKVVKFGGSSLASAEQFMKVKDIIVSDPDRRFVVPSAPGKRYSADTKVTDMLYSCYNLAETDADFDDTLKAIATRYQEIIDGLKLTVSLDSEFEKIKADFKAHAGREYAASRGEYLNGILLANYLGFEFLDSAEYIFFKENGTFDAEKTNDVLSAKLRGMSNAVIPGFYGSLPDGRVKTFSRGGSDITGSIVARAVQANLYENWTDVSGCLVTDPRIVENPKVIDVITYRELRELAYMGFNVLHEDAIFPVRTAGIPINIKNTNAPKDPGTLIVENTSRKPGFTITGVAGKKGFTAINIEKDMMNAEIGFCRRVLQAFEDNGISFEHMPSGIDTMTVVVHQSEFETKEQTVLAEIRKLTNPDSIDISTDIALLAVVGRGMRSNRGVAAKIFSALDRASINIRMIDQGSSELNIIIGVSNNDFEDAINVIYHAFVQ